MVEIPAHEACGCIDGESCALRESYDVVNSAFEDCCTANQDMNAEIERLNGVVARAKAAYKVWEDMARQKDEEADRLYRALRLVGEGRPCACGDPECPIPIPCMCGMADCTSGQGDHRSISPHVEPSRRPFASDLQIGANDQTPSNGGE